MLPFAFKTFVLSIFEWPLKTGFTVCEYVCVIESNNNSEVVCEYVCVHDAWN